MRGQTARRICAHTCTIGLLWLSTSPSVFAQALPAGAEPSRIEQRFEERPESEARPAVSRGLESTMAPAEAANTYVIIDSIRVARSTVYTQDELAPLYSELIGKRVSLAEVFAVAAKVTAKYGQDGYLLSRAIVPLQSLEPNGASITINAIEGYIDRVEWPDGVETYRNFFDEYSAAIMASRPLNARVLERYLLLANDLPGLSFRSSLTASDTNPNASTLVLTMQENAADGYVSVDNHGVEASGPYQAIVGGGLNNRLRIHERIEAAFVVAGPSDDDDIELGYFSGRYEQVVNSEGLRLFVDGNYSNGFPGTQPLLALNFETEGFNASAGLISPFIRRRSESLSGTIAFDYKNSESTNLGLTATRDRLRILRAELAYEMADQVGGTNQLVGTFHYGIDGLGSTANSNPFASRQPGKVDFVRLTGFASRTQTLPNRFSAYFSAFGQVSSDPLLSSQECGYGSRSFGRGFDASIITGDQCAMVSAELRYDAPITGTLSTHLRYIQPYAFVDYGKIWNIDAPLGTPDTDDGASAGLGIRFGSNRLSADLAVTHVLSEPSSQRGIDDVRGWFKVTSRF